MTNPSGTARPNSMHSRGHLPGVNLDDPGSLDQTLERVRLLGHEALVETPPACADLWERARQAGLPIGRLAVVRWPLHPPAEAAHDATRGDIWVWHEVEAADPAAALRETLRRLLHELAHADRRSARPASIDEDWDEEIATERRAQQLAQGWGLLEVLPTARLEERITACERLRERHHAAAELAGTSERAPQLARAAYAALAQLAHERGWDEDTFEAALWGFHNDPAINAAALGFDRAYLRASWRIGWGTGGTLGVFALLPCEGAATLLRQALRDVARHGAQDLARAPWQQISFGPRRQVSRRVALLQLLEPHGLTEAIAAANTLLLANPERSAWASWSCYGGQPGAGQARIYQLSVTYDRDALPARFDDRPKPHPEDASDDVHAGDLWLLISPRSERDLTTEAALHLYIGSWLQVQRLERAPLAHGYASGLATLWEQLALPASADLG